jgi:hypothetical protein
MDRSEVKRIVDAVISREMDCAGVGHFKITVAYGPVSAPVKEGWRDQADCHRMVNYDRARITIDPEQIENKDELLDVLRHELFHVATSPFMLFIEAVSCFVPKESWEAVEAVRMYAEEQAVINLERMRRNLISEFGPKSETAEDRTPPEAPSP